MIPLLALVVGAVGFIYGPERAERDLAGLMREVYPAISGQEVRLVRQLVDGRALSLGLGLVGTLLSATAILGSLDTAISHVLGREGKRKFVRDRLNGLGFISLLLALAIVSFALSYGVQAVAGALVGVRVLRVLLEVAGPLVGLAVGYAFFYMVFRLAPRRAVRHRGAWQAALVSAVLWEVAKIAFAFLTRALGTFQAYGTLAFAFGLLTWIYLTAVIILIGAEVIKTADA